MSHLPPRLAIAIAVSAALPLVPAGCVLPHTLSWELGWAESTLQDRAVAVEVSVLEGGCTGAVLWTAEIPLAGSTEDPPDLGEGLYGFAARARDMQCRWFAQGCREVDLPAEDAEADVRVVLSGATEQEACPADLCIAGVCACSAPGACGTACVGDECACVGGGCVQRCLEGGSCSCTGGGCRVRCDEGASCDCIGGGCIMDCGPEAMCDCLGGNCAFSCDAEATCECLSGGCR